MHGPAAGQGGVCWHWSADVWGGLLASALPQVKEAFDDIGRHRSDKEVNGRRVTLVREEGEVLVKWADVQVGGGGAVAGRACRQPPWYSALAS